MWLTQDWCIIWGVHFQRERGGFWRDLWSIGFNDILSLFVREKCIHLVCEKFLIFSFRQYIIGNIVF